MCSKASAPFPLYIALFVKNLHFLPVLAVKVQGSYGLWFGGFDESTKIKQNIYFTSGVIS